MLQQKGGGFDHVDLSNRIQPCKKYLNCLPVIYVNFICVSHFGVVVERFSNLENQV